MEGWVGAVRKPVASFDQRITTMEHYTGIDDEMCNRIFFVCWIKLSIKFVIKATTYSYVDIFQYIFISLKI